jgi:hypothetical protein
MPALRLAFVLLVVSLAACGPERDRECSAGSTDLTADPENCGACGNVCGEGTACIDSRCLEGACQPGAVEKCYSGLEDTENVGSCVAGTRVCGKAGTWGRCEGEVTPVAENCTDGVDNNCNGMIDEDADLDGDGFTTCGVPGVIPGDCCDFAECSKPKEVNPGAYDAAGNGVDDDCNGVADDTALLCDQGLASSSASGVDFAKAIDICTPTPSGTITMQDYRWGLIDAKLSLTDGTGAPDREGHAIRPRFGTGVVPQGGVSLAMISSGGAAAKNDTNPGYHPWVSYTHTGVNSAPFPTDWYTANGNKLPNAPGCPASSAAQANDPVMLTLRIKVPTNARSFRLSTNFFSAEFPEYTCTQFNDFFVVLLDSMYNGPQPNPADKNLAFFQPAGTMDKFPVGVNLAYGNTGLFTQCVNGGTGCSGSVSGTINTCVATTHLIGTGFDDMSGNCGGSNLNGGATGWLVTAGNVKPGEIITLRIAIWDTSDWAWDSLAVFDGFAWSTELANPGTVIF